MPKDVPLVTMAEAVTRFVGDGQELLLGGFAMSDPVAFGHELMRQGVTGLDLIKTSGGVLVDMLVGAGCVDRLRICHTWNSVGPEPAHCFRRAVESSPAPIRVDELSFGAMTMGFAAAAWGLPFMPTAPMTLSGHDLQRPHWPDKLGTVVSPFEPGRLVTVVNRIAPPLGVFHVHRVDRHGNGQLFGPTAEFRQSIAACERVILVAEELVPTEVVRERPELTVAPGFMVDAVVVQPWAAHPSDSYGYYKRDLDHHLEYGRASRTVEGFQRYLDDWIRGTPDHAAFVRRLGDDRVRDLMLRDRWW
jgi:glutaconate CoA-transferase, subunit A